MQIEGIVSKVVLGRQDSLAVEVEPLSELRGGGRTDVHLFSRSLLDRDALVLVPHGCGWNTVYVDPNRTRLFIVRGSRSEKRIQVLFEDRSGMQSELVLERVCTLSAYKKSA